MISAVSKQLKKQAILPFALVVFTLLLSACDSNDDKEPTEISGLGIRLKHLVTTSQVANSLGNYMQGYETQGTGSFTDEGHYPAIPHIYYYTVNFKNDIDGTVYAWRSINAQTGMGKETKDKILDMFTDMEEITDGRLGKPPYENVFVLGYKNNEKGDWRYELYIRLTHINNQDNQVITLSGTFGPTSHPDDEAIAPEPMNSQDAVSAMLTLVELIPE
ncbi:hypothetical protein [Avrilella dinanensis]|uniref:Lipoprotein n=1 Tax=Avrilella dinanensis TaxID=2008672 RepID=A0A2M9R7Q5_9FLAO|nr:hypothetical protein [Avrilella dinanensis]PJR04871.1 hypothetical protein CDL10_10205 [Avrilella dinanensis]